jgi:crotonobetainyl-CoA:carnitine CoA-transferase CaiB-like acyl-CoA transferase
VNPTIIYARGHGHGVARDPTSRRAGYDAASFWSRGGIAHALTPAGADRPVMQRAAFGDSAGGMTTAGGIAAALFHRERTGEPSVVDVSLLGTAMWILAPDIVLAKFTDQEMPLFERTQAPNPIVNSYKTKDDRWIFLNMLQPDRFWADFCSTSTDPTWSRTRGSRAAWPASRTARECVGELDKTFASRTLAEWREKLDTVEGVWAPMQTAKEVGFDRQALANGYLSEVDRGDGTTFTLVSSPVQFDETTPTLRPGPDMGQHTEEVLLAHGYSWEELAALKEAGAIS